MRREPVCLSVVIIWDLCHVLARKHLLEIVFIAIPARGDDLRRRIKDRVLEIGPRRGADDLPSSACSARLRRLVRNYRTLPKRPIIAARWVMIGKISADHLTCQVHSFLPDLVWKP